MKHFIAVFALIGAVAAAFGFVGEPDAATDLARAIFILFSTLTVVGVTVELTPESR